MSEKTEPSITVIIPCFRSAKVLPDLVSEVSANLSQLTSLYEVVLVVDGSPDDTWHVASSLASRTVRAIRLSRNFGQHNALLAGIRAARHDIIVTMDDDFQHRPSDIAVLVSELAKGFDLVFGVPEKGAHGFIRNRFSKLLKGFLARITHAPGMRDRSAFRAFRSTLRDGMVNISGPHVAINVALGWTTTNIGRVVVVNDPRRVGSSNYSPVSLTRQAINLILGYSVVPLRMVSIGGIVFAMFGLGLVIFEVWSNLTGRITVPGFTTTVALISIFSGAQMLSIGIVGEYLARIYNQAMGRPSYVVAETSD